MCVVHMLPTHLSKEVGCSGRVNLAHGVSLLIGKCPKSTDEEPGELLHKGITTRCRLCAYLCVCSHGFDPDSSLVGGF